MRYWSNVVPILQYWHDIYNILSARSSYGYNLTVMPREGIWHEPADEWEKMSCGLQRIEKLHSLRTFVRSLLCLKQIGYEQSTCNLVVPANNKFFMSYMVGHIHYHSSTHYVKNYINVSKRENGNTPRANRGGAQADSRREGSTSKTMIGRAAW